MRDKTIEVNNGLKFGPVSEPSTAEEYDQLAKRIGACVDDATANVWYRSVLPDIWFGLAVRLNKEYGTKFAMKEGPPKKDGSPRQVRAQSDPQHVDMVAAQQAVSATTFQGFVDEIIRDGFDEVQTDGSVKHYDIKFDPSARERVAGPAKPGKGDLELAKQFIAQPNDGLSITLGKISTVVGQPCAVDGLQGDELLNKVATFVRDYRRVQERLEAEARKNQLMATSAEPAVKKSKKG